jgi:hypothetical protein
LTGAAAAFLDGRRPVDSAAAFRDAERNAAVFRTLPVRDRQPPALARSLE